LLISQHRAASGWEGPWPLPGFSVFYVSFGPRLEGPLVVKIEAW
jgi:hypothetical protein